MPTNILTSRFDRAFKKFVKKNNQLKSTVKETLARFAENPQHPSLHLEKLKNTNIWSIRIDKSNRLFFTWSNSGDTAIFFYVGPHDTYRLLE